MGFYEQAIAKLAPWSDKCPNCGVEHVANHWSSRTIKSAVATKHPETRLYRLLLEFSPHSYISPLLVSRINFSMYFSRHYACYTSLPSQPCTYVPWLIDHLNDILCKVQNINPLVMLFSPYVCYSFLLSTNISFGAFSRTAFPWCRRLSYSHAK
jgi:hypothetical protein